ncbi:MAG TPA: hypothetical protein VJZ76_18415 [Thermoanaerobaculia bacterium]|nr:hypothetical protein [Thermoanaerobaculia bacterium]
MKCAICIFLFWAIAAALLLAANYGIEPRSPSLDGVVKVGVLVLVGFGYMRIMRESTLDHALLVGSAWLALAVVVEVFEASTTGRGWFDLIGSPSHPVIRTVMLIAWVGAPALFARSRSWESSAPS